MLASHCIKRPGQPLANLATYQINAHQIMTTFRDDYVRKSLRGLDELDVHWPDRRDVLVDY
jgi:hypothetical protein